MSQIVLVRHGSLEGSGAVLLGAGEARLSTAGREQMLSLGARLSLWIQGPMAVICSDLERCRESAALIIKAFTPLPALHADPSLREINLGLWQGQSKSRIQEREQGAFLYRGLFPDLFVPPGGESFRLLLRRSLMAIRAWRSLYPQETLLVVTHAGVMRCLVAQALALPLAEVLRIPCPYASYTILRDEDFS